LIYIKDGFYSPYRTKLGELMLKLWSEGMPCLYDIFINLQDSAVNELLAEYHEAFPQDNEGNICLLFPNAKEF
jgi:hypothetical protein